LVPCINRTTDVLKNVWYFLSKVRIKEIRRWFIKEVNQIIGPQLEDIKQGIREKLAINQTTPPSPTITGNGGIIRGPPVRKHSGKFFLSPQSTTKITSASLPSVVSEEEVNISQQEIISLLNIQPEDDPKLIRWICPDPALRQIQVSILIEKVHRLIFIQKRIDEKDVLQLIKIGTLYLKQTSYPPLCCSILGQEITDMALQLTKKYQLQFINIK